MTEPIGGALTLRRTRGDFGPDDYEVMNHGRAIGRIYLCRAAFASHRSV
jgi:hypothetical protein